MGKSIIRRLQALENVSSVVPDQLTITLLDGSKKCVLWTEALLAILNNEVVDIEGEGDLYGLCWVMLNDKEIK